MPVVRYLVDDVDRAIVFYTEVLDFRLVQRMGPPFAMVARGDLTLWLSGPESSARRPMPDGEPPVPGGWNRIVIEVDDLEARVAELESRGATFRNRPLRGPGGTQVLIEDGSGNLVELFQPA